MQKKLIKIWSKKIFNDDHKPFLYKVIKKKKNPDNKNKKMKTCLYQLEEEEKKTKKSFNKWSLP